jgi:hypothetical protein
MTGDVLSLTRARPKPRSLLVKKGRHRRFEEARKLKQSGPGAFDLGLGSNGAPHESQDDDEYAALAEKYGVTFDDEEDEDSEI